MPKKKHFDLKWVVWALGGLGVLSGAIVGTARYITLPERVEAVEKTTNQIADYIKEQQIFNKALKELQEDNGKEKIIYSQDGKWWWDEEKEKWRSISELEREPR